MPCGLRAATTTSLAGLVHCFLQNRFTVFLTAFIADENLVMLDCKFHGAVDRQVKFSAVIEDVGVVSTVKSVRVAVPHSLWSHRNPLHIHPDEFAFLPCAGLGL